MKKIYLGIIVTVVGSLVMFGALLDQWDSESNHKQEPSDLIIYKKMLIGISEQLDGVESNLLINQTSKLADQFSLDLQVAPLSSVSLPESVLDTLQIERSLVLESDSKLIVFNIVKNHPDVLLQLTVPNSQQENYFMDMAMTIALYSGIVLMLFIWLLPLTSRLGKLTELAAEFGNGDLGKRVVLSRFSYIDGLEQSFNQMASRIETLIADNKILAGSLSHDLRTPLACLRFGLEAAIGADSNQKKQVYLNRVENDLTRLEDMLEAFLEYASLEQSGVNLLKRDTSINTLTLSVVEELKPLASDKGIALNVAFDLHEDILIKLDGHWVYRAILNVLSNAIEYAQHNIVIDVNLSSNSVIVSVHDDGIGINHMENEALFAPFSKGDQSRNRDQQHYGLGLAIVSKVLEWHNGQVIASNSNKLSGACFSIHLPVD